MTTIVCHCSLTTNELFPWMLSCSPAHISVFTLTGSGSLAGSGSLLSFVGYCHGCVMCMSCCLPWTYSYIYIYFCILAFSACFPYLPVTSWPLWPPDPLTSWPLLTSPMAVFPGSHRSLVVHLVEAVAAVAEEEAAAASNPLQHQQNLLMARKLWQKSKYHVWWNKKYCTIKCLKY